MITTKQVVKHFGSVKQAAEFFDVEVTAVYQWQDKNRLPKRREYELNLRLPDVFPPSIKAA